MKLLHITPAYFPAFHHGGPISSVHGLNKWLVKKGVSVTVYTTDIDGSGSLNVPTGREVLRDGVKVYYFPCSFRSWSYSCELHRALKRNTKHFDLVHITSVFLAASTLGAYYARKFGKPYIISPRGSFMKEPLEKKSPLKKKLYISLIEKRNLVGAAAIHFTVPREREEYLEYKLPLNKAVVIPNGLDISDFKTNVPLGAFRKKNGISEDKKIILFLSRINWKKGLDTLIPAFAQVLEKEPNSVLIIAGGDDEGYKKKVERWIDEYEVKNKVLFTGMIVGADKMSVLQDSDVFVLPSYSENFGMAVIEAMHFGLPVVITEGVGISLSVALVGAGLVIKKDERELTDAILKILRNSDLAKKMGNQGRDVVKTEFSLAGIAERFMEVYNSLISKKELHG